MPSIEVDLIRFTAGPHKGEHGVMIDDSYEIAIYPLYGDRSLIRWKVLDVHPDASEQTKEGLRVETWMNVNKYKFVYPPSRRVKERVLEVADYYRDAGRVYALTYAPKPFHRLVIGAIIALFASAVATVKSASKKHK